MTFLSMKYMISNDHDMFICNIQDLIVNDIFRHNKHYVECRGHKIYDVNCQCQVNTLIG
jgi:hypothetical protein